MTGYVLYFSVYMQLVFKYFIVNVDCWHVHLRHDLIYWFQNMIYFQEIMSQYSHLNKAMNDPMISFNSEITNSIFNSLFPESTWMRRSKFYCFFRLSSLIKDGQVNTIGHRSSLLPYFVYLLNILPADFH